MPTLNYENAGALVNYDYLQGTITALYPEDDTADVSGVCGELSKIPIFYHCKPDSVQRSNGALVGAAGGFKVGDVVVVLVGGPTAEAAIKEYIVGHYNGVKRCSIPGLVFVASRLYHDTPGIFEFYFWWDLATDDYATWINEYAIYQKSDYPINFSPSAYPIANGMNRFSFIQVPAMLGDSVISRFIISENIISSKTYDFGAAFVQPGDYVYASSAPYIYSKIKSVAGCVLKLNDTVLMTWLSIQPGSLSDDGFAFTVSSSVPLYAAIETWRTKKFGMIPYGDYYITDQNASWITPHFTLEDDPYSALGYRWVPTYTTDNRMWTEHINYLTGAVEKIDFGSVFMSEVERTTYASNIPNPLSQGYSADYAIENNNYISGNLDPLGGIAYSYYGEPLIPRISYYDGGVEKFTNAFNFATAISSFQFYAYNTGIIYAQSSGIAGLSNTRSSKLESAISDLIQSSRNTHSDEETIYTTIEGRYYSETRTATSGSGMLAILNAVRGFPPPLTEDSWCMSSSEEKIASFISSCSCSHGDLSYIGMEVLATALDTVPIGDIVAGWMASPAHAAAIMGPTWEVAGWAEGTYPLSCEGINQGAGAYDAINESYTTEENYQAIPLELRGHVKCYVVRMTPTP